MYHQATLGAALSFLRVAVVLAVSAVIAWVARLRAPNRDAYDAETAHLTSKLSSTPPRALNLFDR